MLGLYRVYSSIWIKKSWPDNPIEIIILFIPLTLRHKKCISQVSTDAQIKDLGKRGCGCLKCCLKIGNDTFACFLTEFDWEEILAEEEILASVVPEVGTRTLGHAGREDADVGSIVQGHCTRGGRAACGDWGRRCFPCTSAKLGVQEADGELAQWGRASAVLNKKGKQGC